MGTPYADAKRQYDAGNFAETIALLAPFVNREENTAAVREMLLLANAYDEVHQHTDALDVLHRLLTYNPRSAEAWNNIGIVCQKIGREDEAKTAFERAYRFDPENAQFLINLGALHLKLGDIAAAKEHLQLALNLDASHPAAHANMAIVLAMFGRLEEAEESLRLAVLYGFNTPEPIQDRLNKMRAIRDDIVSQKTALERAEETGVTDDEREARARLEANERTLRALVQQRYERIYDPEAATVEDEELDGRIAALRMEVREQRKAFGEPEITEEDIFMGENYMTTEEEET